MAFKDERRSLLTSSARVQVPWIKVVIGNYTFGVFSRKKSATVDEDGFSYTDYSVQYPNYVQSLNIEKINGQVNTYTLNLQYPVTYGADPNFIEKVLSSISSTRKITFSYGDMSMPSYIYKNEEAIITKVTTSFAMTGILGYTITAVSSGALSAGGVWTFQGKTLKPSEEIKRIFRDKRYQLSSLFTGMNEANIDYLIAGDDKPVKVDPKRNISALDYITYLVSCMLPSSYSKSDGIDTDLYMLTMHDDTCLDENFINGERLSGSYFKVTKITKKVEQSDAFVIDIGFGNSGSPVVQFQTSDSENYSMLYNYNMEQEADSYTERVDSGGNIVEVWAPSVMSRNGYNEPRAADITWWTQITKYPIKATIKILGLLRPAMLMTYVRLNVIFPGGRKHIASGLYLVTKQVDDISGSGYFSTLQLQKISGDDTLQ